jgi:hypothetical protein
VWAHWPATSTPAARETGFAQTVQGGNTGQRTWIGRPSSSRTQPFPPLINWPQTAQVEGLASAMGAFTILCAGVKAKKIVVGGCAD